MKIRDPIHEFMDFDDEETKIINLPVFQRLRRIKQLAMECLVYPGALHTRFEHSLGVAHLASVMADKLEIKNGDKRLLRYAALLHDIGHGPFSHVSEDILERFADENCITTGSKKEKIHETITQRIIQENNDLKKKLGSSFLGDISALLKDGGDREELLKQVISGPLDVDKQDYLLRDSKYCGVSYGVYDIRQFHRSLVTFDTSDQRKLALREEDVHVMEQFALAKYYMTTMVYGHRVRLISDQMIVRAISLGIENDKIEEMEKLYHFRDNPSFFENYLAWDDQRFMERFFREGDPDHKSYQILERIHGRKLFKQVFRAGIDKFDPKIRSALHELDKRGNSKRRKNIEFAIANAVNDSLNLNAEKINPDFVILHKYSFKSVRESARNDESEVYVKFDQEEQTPIPFDEASVLFKSIKDELTEEIVEVYAPIDWSSKKQKNEKLRLVSEPIYKIISEEIAKDLPTESQEKTP